MAGGAVAESASALLRVGLLVTRNPVTLRPLSEFETAYLQFRDGLLLRGGERTADAGAGGAATAKTKAKAKDKEKDKAGGRRGGGVAPRPTKAFAHEHFFKRGSLQQQKWHAAHSHSDLRFSSPDSPLPLPPALAAQADDELRAVLAAADAAHDAVAAKDRDHTDLARRPSLPLYLVVKPVAIGSWSLPALPLANGELLHSAADRSLALTCGNRLEAWPVARVPVAHLVSKNSKTFIMKQLILSGTVVLNPEIASEYAWLSKDEMAQNLDKDYYESIKDIL
ncbi:54S ribosomal protein L17 mitochondrial [Physocladia obscura]|uniref:54S ribosomal protein L17 mitochondrial n=1 Tax=Physocladia obscura TaxID=109957 RepID=A0AAD5SPL7_9FUNG|nr:54S ribosomal protein L17 mitochondrial [Physocladia obscura]